jgi:hypothetical protein
MQGHAAISSEPEPFPDFVQLVNQRIFEADHLTEVFVAELAGGVEADPEEEAFGQRHV